MHKIHHLNCVEILAPTGDRAIGNCTVLEVEGKLILLDAGISLEDNIADKSRFSSDLVQAIGFKLDTDLAAVNQLRQKGLSPHDVTDIVVTHLDCDHIGGLIDFPNARVHLSQEEYQNYLSDNPRYIRTLMSHNPTLIQYQSSTSTWNGLEVRKVAIGGVEIYLTPLFGHTLGHCGVIYYADAQWWFYIGDAYYIREELTNENHPVHELTTARADDNTLRLESLRRIKQFMKDYPEVNVYGYHDASELEMLSV